MEDLDVQVLRMRFCHFGFKYDCTNKLPSGSFLQGATTCKRISTHLWTCICKRAGKPAVPTEQVLDWYGQGAQESEWRNKTQTIMTARLIAKWADIKRRETIQVLYI
eukprot:9490039-Pyramimonas_sp.AAC.1